MSLVYADRVQETTATTGTGTLTLAGASTQYQSFATVGNANTCDYCLLGGNGTDWETGRGTYTASGTTLSRDAVFASSAAGAKISLTGTSTVFLTVPANREPSLLVASASATLAFTGLTGNSWRLVGTNLLPSVNSVRLFMEFGTGAGPTYITAGYEHEHFLIGENSFSAASGGSSEANALLGTTQVPNTQPGETFTLDVNTDNANWVQYFGHAWNKNTDTHHYHQIMAGGVATSAQITAIKFYFTAGGNIASGTISLEYR